jgi:hypothetical protein
MLQAERQQAGYRQEFVDRMDFGTHELVPRTDVAVAPG